MRLLYQKQAKNSFSMRDCISHLRIKIVYYRLFELTKPGLKPKYAKISTNPAHSRSGKSKYVRESHYKKL